jgi:predicted nucleotidyltransferase
MSKLSLAAILERITQEFLNQVTNTPNCLVVYGSAATGEYDPRRSDINLAAVVDEIDLGLLERVRKFTRRVAKLRVVPPLMMTPRHLATSADVFPIEFLEIKEKHQLLAGRDLFEKLTIDMKNLRHECEHELKGRILRLRQSYLEQGDHPGKLSVLITTAHQANFPAFRTALRLKGLQPSIRRQLVAEELCAAFGLSSEVFGTLNRIILRQVVMTPSGATALLEQYLQTLEKLADAIDQI